jgi:hypothetical protein
MELGAILDGIEQLITFEPLDAFQLEAHRLKGPGTGGDHHCGHIKLGAPVTTEPESLAPRFKLLDTFTKTELCLERRNLAQQVLRQLGTADFGNGRDIENGFLRIELNGKKYAGDE